MNLEREYLQRMFVMIEKELDSLTPEARRSFRLAKSVVETHGMATTEELRRELGENWVLHRRTKRIVERYGKGVKCYSQRQFHAAEVRAIEARF